MKKGIVVLILCLGLWSCISIESDMTIKDDGSGSFTLVYHVSSLMKELGRIGEEVRQFPLPLYKEDFEKLLAVNDGLTMKSHSVKEADDESIIKAVFSFENVEACSFFGDQENDTFFFGKSAGVTVFRQYLPYGGLDEQDDDALAMLKAYCSDDYISYSIHTPKPIKEFSLGEVSENKKHLVYKIGIIELLTVKEKLVLEVKW